MPTQPTKFTWMSIPTFAQPGSLHAFVDRDEELARLYTGMVHAGNAVRAGKLGASKHFAVVGPKGGGKSALILQALGMIRGQVVEGQRLDVPPDLPEPHERERWLTLWLSGKPIANTERIPDALQRDLIAVLDETREQAERVIPSTLSLPLFDRVFRSREASEFAKVRTALRALAETIRFVRLFLGNPDTVKLVRNIQTQSSQEAAVNLEGQLKAQGVDVGGTEAKAGLKAAASYLRKTGSTVSMDVESKRVVEAEWAVEALNDFFAATDAAGIPTIVALDDFDEFASSAGPAHAERAKVLFSVLGAFLRLRPTCFVLALRSEYMMEDIRRTREVVYVPPMTRASGREALSAWGHVFDLSNDAGRAFVELGDRFLDPFGEDERVVHPLSFLQLVGSVSQLHARIRESRTTYQHILDYIGRQGPYDLKRIAEDIVKSMPSTDIEPCATGAALDPKIYDLDERDRGTLEAYGLIRPARAGDPNDTRIVLDPLFAYLRANAAPKITLGDSHRMSTDGTMSDTSEK